MIINPFEILPEECTTETYLKLRHVCRSWHARHSDLIISHNLMKGKKLYYNGIGENFAYIWTVSVREYTLNQIH